MTLYPNCKINIGLHILGKRPDGYHNLESIFYPVPLTDILDVEPSPSFQYAQSGLLLDCPTDDNLLIRCYNHMRMHFPQIGNVSIRFTKRIPYGAGLGGGSSDAAHMAIALNHLFHLNLTRNQLAKLVAPLGADCPFFIYNTPCLAQGIGDCLTPIPFSLHGYWLVMVKPNISVSTREAYEGISSFGKPVLLHENLSELFNQQRNLFNNDFEQSIFPRHPELHAIKQQLMDAGAVFASMSGSGSTIYGLFTNEQQARTINNPIFCQLL